MDRIGTCLAVLIWSSITPVRADRVEREAFGCKSLAAAEHLLRRRVAADRGDHRDSLGRLSGLGEYRRWLPGDEVVRKDADGDFVCIAPKGSGTCYWTQVRLID